MEKEGHNRPLLRRMSEKTLQDLMAIFLPHMLIEGRLTIGASYVFDPTMMQLLYAALSHVYEAVRIG